MYAREDVFAYVVLNEKCIEDLPLQIKIIVAGGLFPCISFMLVKLKFSTGYLFICVQPLIT